MSTDLVKLVSQAKSYGDIFIKALKDESITDHKIIMDYACAYKAALTKAISLCIYELDQIIPIKELDGSITNTDVDDKTIGKTFATLGELTFRRSQVNRFISRNRIKED